MARGDSQNEPAFAGLIRRARKARGWTQQDLADHSEIGVRTLIRWEAGEVTEPEAQQVIAAAEALGVPRIDVFRALGWLPEYEEAQQEDLVTNELLELRELVAETLKSVDEALQNRRVNHS